ncbi:MAG: chromosome segregation protein SMC [Clostridia bacterium]|nr:chromosome segregation protein SMC [Clostridia bacterium]
MFLKSLELYGFKSFPDKTKLHFDRGVTAVIGPNGSGKSNISDAMKWVLGEISSKNLRGSSMEDVIFSGSSTKKPMNFAEVSVTFDNSFSESGNLLSDEKEITVTRRYYRVGESEYFINQKPCKLKDIHELFLNTGIGREGYSIVGQGKIADIVSQRNESRRNVLEEAAGISKYRYKKKEAQRKLESVEANLIRVKDIAAELEGRVGPLEEDAKKVRKYLDLYERKKQIDIGLFLFDAKDSISLYEKYESELGEARLEYDSSASRLAEYEQNNEKIFEASQENKRPTTELMEQIRDIGERRVKLEGDMRLCESEIFHAEENKKILSSECETIKAELDEKNAALSEAQTKALEHIATKDSLQAELDKLESEILDVRSDAVVLGNDVYDSKNELEENEKKLTEAKIALSVFDTNTALASQRLSEIKAQSEEIKSEKDKLENQKAELEKENDNYRLQRDKAKEEITEKEADNDALIKKHGDITEKLSDLKIELGSRRGKLENLMRMDELFEGYSRSVKFLMNEFSRGSIKRRNGAKCQIYGPVSKLISAEDMYVLAIETALGANIQNIVCESEEDAKCAIEFLKNSKAGRATFYPVMTMKSSNASGEIAGIRSNRGYIGIASDLVRCDAKYRPVIDNLLGRTVISDSIDSAAEMAKMLGYRLRFVTLDGQIVNAGGSFTGGSSRQESGILSRSAEIEKLKSRIGELEKEILGVSEELAENDRLSTSVLSMIKDGNLKITMLEAMISDVNSKISAVDAKIDSANVSLDAIFDEAKRSDEDSTAHDQKRAELENEISKIGAVSEEITKRIEQKSKDITEIENKIAKMRDDQSKKQISLAELRRDCAADEASVSLWQDEINKLSLKIEHAQSEIENSDLKIGSSRSQIEQTKKLIEILSEELSEKQNLHTQKSGDELDFESKLSALREKIKEESQKKELLSQNVVKLENKCNEIKNGHDKLTAAMWEDYELSYTTALDAPHIEINSDNKREYQSEQNGLKSKIKALGNVNMTAIEEYNEVKTRYDFLSAQITDLTDSKEDLCDIIRKLEREMTSKFAEAFDSINKNFGEVFSELFGGGKAELILADPEHILESDIEIAVAPPGKIIKNMSLLSGGEQAFCAIALYFAILRISPTPFCIFDEIEAALDDANVDRFADYIHKYSENTQIIIITHRRGTMETADRLYGVTMPKKGVSNIFELNAAEVSVNFNVN